MYNVDRLDFPVSVEYISAPEWRHRRQYQYRQCALLLLLLLRRSSYLRSLSVMNGATPPMYSVVMSVSSGGCKVPSLARAKMRFATGSLTP